MSISAGLLVITEADFITSDTIDTAFSTTGGGTSAIVLVTGFRESWNYFIGEIFSANLLLSYCLVIERKGDLLSIGFSGEIVVCFFL